MTTAAIEQDHRKKAEQEASRQAATERLMNEGELPTLSDHGRPRVCPMCGGASVYALHMAMDGRACRYASKGDMIIAFYCGEHERRREAFDVDLHGDTRAGEISDWNTEVLGAVRGTAQHVLRDIRNLNDLSAGLVRQMQAHIETQQAALAEVKASEQKLLAAVPAKKKRARRKP